MAQRTIQDLTEQAEELGDVRARSSALAPSEGGSAEPVRTWVVVTNLHGHCTCNAKSPTVPFPEGCGLCCVAVPDA